MSIEFLTELDWKLVDQSSQIIIGFSGGVDSSVLLHYFVSTYRERKNLQLEQTPTKVKVIHVNHNIHIHAHEWQEFCRLQCKKLGVEFFAEQVQIEATDTAYQYMSETDARKKRYVIFAKYMNEKNSLLLQAHHADDQIETFIFRLIRGSGVNGLASIPMKRSLGAGMIFRPMLNFTRTDIMNYATKHYLGWVEDSSNTEVIHDRNFIRHQLLPKIYQHWPHAKNNFRRVVALVKEEIGLLNDLSLLDLEKIDVRQEKLGYSLCSLKLKCLPLARQSNVLRFWIHQYAGRAPNYKELNQLLLFIAKKNKSVFYQLKISSGSIRYYNDRLYWLSSLALLNNVSDQVVIWNMQDLLSIDNVIQIRAPQPIDKQVTVSFRRGGERCHPSDRNKSQCLKKIFQEYKLEPWYRYITPIVYHEDEIIAVGDLFVCRQNSLGLNQQLSLAYTLN